MNKAKPKNYYEILDVAPGATREEIEDAYRRARATYGEDSVALYSLYSREEQEAILDEIKEAYNILKAASRRDAYNASYPGTNEGTDEPRLLREMNSGPGPAQQAAKDVDEFMAAGTAVRLKEQLLATDGADPVAAEQYRVLYTKLEHISIRHSYKVFAVTSALKGEGKTITSLNLAYTIANDFKKKVVLVECDLKKPSLLSYFMDTESVKDIVDVTGGGADLGGALMHVEESGLYLLPARRSVKNSSELLGSQRMRSVLNALKTEFDYVIVDSPPILHLADMNIISRLVDGLILVVRAGKTPKDMVVKASKSIQNANIVGIVLNGADISLNRYYYR